MTEHFTPRTEFTDKEFESLIVETQFGRAPTSMDKSYLESRQLSNDQIQSLFDRNLTRNHTVAVLNYGNSVEGINLYKKHLQSEHENKISPILGSASKTIEKVKHGIEKNKGSLRID